MRTTKSLFMTYFWLILTYFSSFLVYLLVFYEYVMRICKNMCKFNPNNHYYFNDALHFFKSYKIKSEPGGTFNTTLTAYVFRKLWTVKCVVRSISKNPCFRTPSDSHHAKRSQRLLKSAPQHFYHIPSSLWLK